MHEHLQEGQIKTLQHPYAKVWLSWEFKDLRFATSECVLNPEVQWIPKLVTPFEQASRQSRCCFCFQICSLGVGQSFSPHQEIQEKSHTALWICEGKCWKAKDSFKKPFDKKIMFNGLKMLSFRCRSHVQEINMPKDMFGCPLKLILGLFTFLALN
jgi:hypothetical protein